MTATTDTAARHARSALIGHTGLVGSNLREQFTFTDLFNTQNIQTLAGHYDLLVCAGSRGTKWKANAEPERDWNDLQRLMDSIRRVTARVFVLISTVDVYPDPRRVDESVAPQESDQPYGRHRWRFERFVEESFPTVHTIRLPGLFGEHLKKNSVYDLLHDHEVYKLNPKSTYQYYWLGRLWQDIERAIANRLSLLNLAVEPVRLGDIAQLFQRSMTSHGSEVHYDMWSRHAGLWGHAGHYLYPASTVMSDLKAFFESANRARSGGV